MNNELPLDYLHRQVEGLIYEHNFMPKFLDYNTLQKLVKEEFERIKKYEEFFIIQFASKIASKYGKTNVNIDSIEKFYHENFTKPYDENKVTSISNKNKNKIK